MGPYTTSFSQAKIQNDIARTDSLRKGIYMNFNEFRRNNPSDRNEFHFFQTSPSAVAKGALPNFLYQVNATSGQNDTITHGIWGFCNGNQIYKLVEGDSIVPSYYSKILYVGRYCYYEDHVIFSIDAGGLLTANPTIKREKVISYVININNGKEFRIDDKMMGSILKDDQELYDQYKNEKKRHLTYGKYIELYSEKNVDQIKK